MSVARATAAAALPIDVEGVRRDFLALDVDQDACQFSKAVGAAFEN